VIKTVIEICKRRLHKEERKSIYLPDRFDCSPVNLQRGYQKTRGDKGKDVSHGMRSLITEVRDEKVLLFHLVSQHLGRSKLENPAL